MQPARTATRGSRRDDAVLPLLPLKDLVVFPHMVVPLLVGRAKSVRAVETALTAGSTLVLATQRNPHKDDPGVEDIHSVGTESKILQVFKMPDGSVKVLVEGLARRRIVAFTAARSCFRVRVEGIRGGAVEPLRSKALARSLGSLFEQYVRLNPRVPNEVIQSVQEIEDPDRLVDAVCTHALLSMASKQRLLGMPDPEARMKRLAAWLNEEIQVLQIEHDISGKVRKQIEKSQRTFYLQEQLKAIERELGREEPGDGEVALLERRIRRARMGREGEARALSELEKLARMPSLSPEATVTRNYIEWLIELPWSKKSKDNVDVEHAARVLDEDHYALNEPKERVLEYLAVRRLRRKMKGPILCFVGPPGVGKTSLARSVARALGRQFVRVSLGGVRDEAEIRGHRRTYVGALPGGILQSLRRTKTRNPVFLLDEIDKISSDFRGDPSSALLEVLDAEQNNAFSDHYLEVPFDLSDVMFIATANVPHAIHPTLVDRMEIIRLPGYTEWEKAEIAHRFLIPKQLRDNGLGARRVRFSRDTVLRIIREYTSEAGVRDLERSIARICRKIARKVASNRNGPINVGAGNLKTYLGVPRFRHDRAERRNLVGVATGLAWTESGGEVLKVETSVMDGKGRLTLTGQLGDVMRESAEAALSYIRAHRDTFGLDSAFHRRCDIHVHVPEGQTPKDGPSAGIAILFSLASALTGRPLRSDIAVTGEITLRGALLRVGGIKEKVLAAHRSGVKRVLLPADNADDLAEIPKRVRRDCKVITCETVDEVTPHLFDEVAL